MTLRGKAVDSTLDSLYAQYSKTLTTNGLGAKILGRILLSEIKKLEKIKGVNNDEKENEQRNEISG